MPTPDDDWREEVVDLRDAAPPMRPPSGRPADLQPGHRLARITGGDLWTRCEAFVYDIYRQIGYCEESPRRRVEELARWADRSTFYAVLTEDDDVVGLVRAIVGPYDELPIGQFPRTDHSLGDPVCELSSLTVSNDLRSTGVIEHLYIAGWVHGHRTQCVALVGLIDEWLFEVFQQTYHMPFHVIGASMPYMGSDPMPVAMRLAGSEYRSISFTNPEFWAWARTFVTSDEVVAWDLPPIQAPAAPPVAPTPRTS